jgi:hypothetical protein
MRAAQVVFIGVVAAHGRVPLMKGNPFMAAIHFNR